MRLLLLALLLCAAITRGAPAVFQAGKPIKPASETVASSDSSISSSVGESKPEKLPTSDGDKKKKHGSENTNGDSAKPAPVSGTGVLAYAGSSGSHSDIENIPAKVSSGDEDKKKKKKHDSENINGDSAKPAPVSGTGVLAHAGSSGSHSHIENIPANLPNGDEYKKKKKKHGSEINTVGSETPRSNIEISSFNNGHGYSVTSSSYTENGQCVEVCTVNSGTMIDYTFETPCTEEPIKVISSNNVLIVGDPNKKPVAVYSDDPNSLIVVSKGKCKKKIYYVKKGKVKKSSEKLDEDECLKLKEKMSKAQGKNQNKLQGEQGDFWEEHKKRIQEEQEKAKRFWEDYEKKIKEDQENNRKFWEAHNNHLWADQENNDKKPKLSGGQDDFWEEHNKRFQEAGKERDKFWKKFDKDMKKHHKDSRNPWDGGNSFFDEEIGNPFLNP